MATLIQRENDEVTFQVTVRLGGTMLEMEATILEAVNDLGRSATEDALQRFDTDGSPIQLGANKWTARSREDTRTKRPMGRCALSATSIKPALCSKRTWSSIQ